MEKSQSGIVLLAFHMKRVAKDTSIGNKKDNIRFK